MIDYNDFSLSEKQLNYIKRIKAAKSIRKYIKEHGTAPDKEIISSFYTATEKDIEQYRNIFYSLNVNNEYEKEFVYIVVGPGPEIPDDISGNTGTQGVQGDSNVSGNTSQSGETETQDNIDDDKEYYIVAPDSVIIFRDTYYNEYASVSASLYCDNVKVLDATYDINIIDNGEINNMYQSYFIKNVTNGVLKLIHTAPIQHLNFERECIVRIMALVNSKVKSSKDIHFYLNEAGTSGNTSYSGETEPVTETPGDWGFDENSGNTSQSGSTEMSGNTTGNTSHSATTEVSGNTNMSGSTEMSGNTNMSGSTEMSGNTGTQGVQGDSNISGNTEMSGNTNMSGNTTGNTSHSATTEVSGNTSQSGSTEMSGNTVIGPDVEIPDDVNPNEISGNTSYSGNTSTNGSDIVSGNSQFIADIETINDNESSGSTSEGNNPVAETNGEW